jgi:hypothetical protein
MNATKKLLIGLVAVAAMPAFADTKIATTSSTENRLCPCWKPLIDSSVIFLRLRRLQDVAVPHTRYLLGLLFRSVSSLLRRIGSKIYHCARRPLWPLFV